MDGFIGRYSCILRLKKRERRRALTSVTTAWLSPDVVVVLHACEEVGRRDLHSRIGLVRGRRVNFF